MSDTDDNKLKAEIDEIIKRVDSILKNIDEMNPAPKEAPKPQEDE